MNIEQLKKAWKNGRITKFSVDTFLGTGHQIVIVSKDGTECGLLAENQQDYYSVEFVDEALQLIETIKNDHFGRHCQSLDVQVLVNADI